MQKGFPRKWPGGLRMGPFELLQKIVEILERLQIHYLINGYIVSILPKHTRQTSHLRKMLL